MWQTWWVEQNQEVQELQERLETSDELINQLYEQLQSLTAEAENEGLEDQS